MWFLDLLVDGPLSHREVGSLIEAGICQVRRTRWPPIDWEIAAPLQLSSQAVRSTQGMLLHPKRS